MVRTDPVLTRETFSMTWDAVALFLAELFRVVHARAGAGSGVEEWRKLLEDAFLLQLAQLVHRHDAVGIDIGHGPVIPAVDGLIVLRGEVVQV